MYRLLRAVGESRERRAQRQHPRYAMPRLVAAAPNQVWSWDITKLGGPVKWLYFSLYVVLDIFSRYVVGWLVAERENHELAARLITQSEKTSIRSLGQCQCILKQGFSKSFQTVTA